MALNDGAIILFLVFVILCVLALGAALGYWIARRFYQMLKWKDREAALNAKWETKLVAQKTDDKTKLEKVTHDLKLEMAKHQAENQKHLKDWNVRYVSDIEELQRVFKEQEKEIKKRSVSASRRTLVGKFIERFVPFLKNCPFAPSDMHFLGQPVDYIVFDGLRDNKIEKVYFVEVKTGQSKLTPREKSLKDTITKKKVYWKELRVDTDSDSTPDDEIATGDDTSVELHKIIESKLAAAKETLGDEVKMTPGNYTFECSSCSGVSEVEIDKQDAMNLAKWNTLEADCGHCHEVNQLDSSSLSESE